MVTLDALNAADRAGFVAALDGVFEHAPWVAEAAFADRPFATVTALHERLLQAVRERPEAERVAFIQAHPDLAGKAARAGTLTAESRSEQAGAGLDRLSETEYQRFHRANDAHRARFGFPFVICVRRQTRRAILAAFDRRLAHDRAAELDAALAEIGHITRLRLVEKVTGPGLPQTSGRLSTHVLDTHAGRPAAGIALTLSEVAEDGSLFKIAEAATNADGRTDAPLIGGRPIPAGIYQLEFAVGGYFAGRGVALSDPPFLDRVPLRFGIAEPEGHYHVPLLVTPWSYQTYRGS